jgi:phosphate-selective porin OprO/OprP
MAAEGSAADRLLQRLEALETRVRLLEARNAELEAAALKTAAPVSTSGASSASSVLSVASSTTPAVAVAVSSPAPVAVAAAQSDFTIKPRAMVHMDFAAFHARAGGYDFNNGTDLRRGRFGLEGTLYTAFKWRVDAEFVKKSTKLLDAYLQYAVSPRLSVTIGQHKAPFGLEGNSSDAINTFMERGMAVNAFSAVGAERRVGVSLAYTTPHLMAAFGVFGSGEDVTRNATTPDEGYGVNGRVVVVPVQDKTTTLQLGVAGYHATNFAADSVSVGDRPGVRVDDGNLIEAKSITHVRDADYVGAEAIAIHGPFSVQGEYGRLMLSRDAGLANLDFDGFYVFGSWVLTGEQRAVKNGVVDRLKPLAKFDPRAGKWGAVELAARYDQLDLTDTGLSPLTRKAVTWTGAVNWYLNPYARILFNYIRFKGTNSPLVASPLVDGATAKGDAFATRLQFDF